MKKKIESHPGSVDRNFIAMKVIKTDFTPIWRAPRANALDLRGTFTKLVEQIDDEFYLDQSVSFKNGFIPPRGNEVQVVLGVIPRGDQFDVMVTLRDKNQEVYCYSELYHTFIKDIKEANSTYGWIDISVNFICKDVKMQRWKLREGIRKITNLKRDENTLYPFDLYRANKYWIERTSKVGVLYPEPFPEDYNAGMRWKSVDVYNDGLVAPSNKYPIHKESSEIVDAILIAGKRYIGDKNPLEYTIMVHKDITSGNLHHYAQRYINRLAAPIGITFELFGDRESWPKPLNREEYKELEANGGTIPSYIWKVKVTPISHWGFELATKEQLYKMGGDYAELKEKYKGEEVEVVKD